MVSAIFEKLTEILLISFQNRRILKHLPQKMDTIIDVGAHEGQMFISLNKFKTEFCNLSLQVLSSSTTSELTLDLKSEAIGFSV